jgi:hypothetical protein
MVAKETYKRRRTHRHLTVKQDGSPGSGSTGSTGGLSLFSEMFATFALLKTIGTDWSFNTFFLAESNKKPLMTVAKYVTQKFELDPLKDIETSTLEAFFSRVEGEYKPNPYHNATHAADVLCSIIFFVRSSELYT